VARALLAAASRLVSSGRECEPSLGDFDRTARSHLSPGISPRFRSGSERGGCCRDGEGTASLPNRIDNVLLIRFNSENGKCFISGLRIRGGREPGMGEPFKTLVATLLLDANVDMIRVKELFGHASTTIDDASVRESKG
jgi:hypothetical protein